MAKELTNAMPFNRDAEMALLGCILIDNELATDIVEKLHEDDFYQESHKYIINGMKRVFESRNPIDIVTLCDELEKEGNLQRAGGIAYVTELAQITPSSANYKTYMEIVERDSTNRKLIRASKQIIEHSLKGSVGRDAISFAEKLVYDISKEVDGSKLLGIQESGAVDAVLDKFQKLQSNKDAFKGLETPFTRLNQMTNGLQPSDLIVLAARPGMGKTSFAMNLVEHAAVQKGRVCAVFSLEMPYTQIVQRMLCSCAQVSMQKALSGQLSQSEWKKIFTVSEKLDKSRIYIDDSSVVTPAEILSKCRRLKAREGSLDLIMIDYIQLMNSGTSKLSGGENRQQEIASITRDLKIMAKELGVPVIALSQLRRMQTKEPQLSDLRESGAIEQDADIVMFINRQDETATSQELASGAIARGATQLHIAKHRNGETGRINLRFIGECTKFVDVEDQNMDEEPPQYVKRPRAVENAEAVFDETPPMEEPRYGSGDEEELPFD